MVNLFKLAGLWLRSIQGWLWMTTTVGPAIAAWIGGVYDGLPWAHRIAFSMLALAGGGMFAASLVSMWESLVGRKERALLALGRLWEDGVDFRAVASRRPPPLSAADKATIQDFEREIIENIGIVSRPSQSRFRRLNTIHWPDHPPQVQLIARGGEIDLGAFSELLKRVDEFIQRHKD